MPIVPILCGVLLIGGIVALVLSAATWRWYHITLGAFIMLLSLVWFYLAARTLQIQTVWRNEIAKYETALTQEAKSHDQLIQGGPGAGEKEHLSFAQTQTNLEKMLQGRGRIWGGGNESKETNDAHWAVVARKAIAPDGKITAVVNSPTPSGIEKNMVLYVFDDLPADSAGQFLGQFEVTAVNAQEIQLTPALKLRPSELQRLALRRTDPLILYEVMPTDSHEAFADWIKSHPQDWSKIVSQLGLPGEQYAKDGQPPDANTPPELVWRRVKALKDFDVTAGSGANKQTQHVTADAVLELDPQSAQQQIAAGNVAPLPENNAVYVRPLRDYVRLYRDLNLEIEGLLRTTAEVDSENAAVQDAQQKASKDIEYRTAEIAALQRDLVRFQAEAEMIKNHVAALEKQVALVNDQVSAAEKQNQQYEVQLNAYQHQAAVEINRRIQAATQASNKDLLPSGK
ncbi:MAG TPA: hypothetical protein VFE46_19370 [Pirellulales bacterium]|jgi:hypothetical protein|nr:hypothetical protein [Pirellulales bacterium]